MEAIDMYTDFLYKQTLIMPIDRDTFKMLAKIASCDIIFDTHEGFYKQVNGLAMGSPPDRTPSGQCNGWLSTFDKTIKGESKLYYRYMDDVLCSIDKVNINDHLHLINNLHISLLNL